VPVRVVVLTIGLSVLLVVVLVRISFRYWLVPMHVVVLAIGLSVLLVVVLVTELVCVLGVDELAAIPMKFMRVVVSVVVVVLDGLAEEAVPSDLV